MKFQGQQYVLNQAENLFEFIDNSKPREYTIFYDKVVFHTERNGFISAYKDNLSNYWEI